MKTQSNPLLRPRTLLLSAAVAAVVSGLSLMNAEPAMAARDTGLMLDQSKLPPFNQFKATDLDAARNACTDFNGFVNGRWLAANAIPGDRTSWGAFEMLGERSLAVQQQLAEQAAAMKGASGVEKIVGDFWATGMDEAKIEAAGIAPPRSCSHPSSTRRRTTR